MVKRKTAKGRFSRAVKAANDWCRDHRHWPIAEQQRILSMKLRGHYAYFGITGNAQGLSRLLYEVRHRWKKWLGRRNWRTVNVERFKALYAQYPLPPAICVHSKLRHAANPP